MYKVILVDDEPYILTILKDTVDWHKFNMEVCNIFESSLDALEYLKTHDIDLVITDILLPEMTGMELIELSREINENTMYIILSAYDNFDYAVNALKLNVFDYALKPLDYDKFENILLNVSEKLAKTTKVSDTDFDFLMHSDTAIQFIKEEITASEFLSILKDDGHSFYSSDPQCFILKFKINNLTDYLSNVWKHGIDRLYSTINYFMRAISDNKIIFIPITLIFNDLTFFAVAKDNSFNSLKSVESFTSKLCKNISAYIKADMEFYDIKFFNDLSNSQKVASLFVDFPEQDTSENYNPIGQSIKYIHEHYMEDISLTEVSRIVCLSPYHFSRLFKKETGENLIDYINKVRIEKAHDLIIATNDNITSIYKAVGFNSKNYFYKLFKKYYSLTPQQYRNEKRK